MIPMQNLARKSLQVKLISIILISSFALSSLGSGSISAWAQQSSNYLGPGMQNANMPPHGVNPCPGPQGNFTGMHSFGQQGNTGMQHTRPGNYTGMHPCSNQTTNPPVVSGNNISTPSVATVSTTSSSVPSIPSWIKNNAKLWSNGTLDDSTFAQGIQYLIQQKIVNISSTHSGQSTAGVKIPQWVRTDASSWASDQIDDSTFIGAIQYLVQSGVISP